MARAHLCRVITANLLLQLWDVVIGVSVVVNVLPIATPVLQTADERSAQESVQ